MSKNIIKEITEVEDGVKLGNYLKYELKFSTRLIRKIAKENRVLINGKYGRNSYLLKKGDKIEVIIQGEETQDIEAEEMDIDVVYEDSDILIVNKPPNMVVHPTKGHPYGTLSNGVVNYFRKTGQSCIVRLVNRLDRDTSGLVMIAKSQYAHQAMAQKLIDDLIEKYYLAIVEGKLEGDGTIDKPIGKPHEDSIMREVIETGQRAVTHYSSIRSNGNVSYVQVKLETGRTHQIRVHMKSIGHPIVGDSLYGQESDFIARQALHAYKLIFNRIRDDETLEVVAKLPEDMKQFLSINKIEES